MRIKEQETHLTLQEHDDDDDDDDDDKENRVFVVMFGIKKQSTRRDSKEQIHVKISVFITAATPLCI